MDINVQSHGYFHKLCKIQAALTVLVLGYKTLRFLQPFRKFNLSFPAGLAGFDKKSPKNLIAGAVECTRHAPMLMRTC